MTILGPDGTPVARGRITLDGGPVTTHINSLTGAPGTPEQQQVPELADESRAFWAQVFPEPEALCGAATFGQAQAMEFRRLAEAGAPSGQILQVLGQMATDIAVLHAEHHADASEAVIDVPARPVTDEDFTDLPVLHLGDLAEWDQA